jgi:hypothetical protein
MFYFSVLWQFFHIVAYNAEHFSALLPTTQKKVPRVAYNGDHFSTLWATTQKSALLSVHVWFSALLPTRQISFLHCEPQHRNIICVDAYNVEKWSALLATTR